MSVEAGIEHTSHLLPVGFCLPSLNGLSGAHDSKGGLEGTGTWWVRWCLGCTLLWKGSQKVSLFFPGWNSVNGSPEAPRDVCPTASGLGPLWVGKAPEPATRVPPALSLRFVGSPVKHTSLLWLFEWTIPAMAFYSNLLDLTWKENLYFHLGWLSCPLAFPSTCSGWQWLAN